MPAVAAAALLLGACAGRPGRVPTEATAKRLAVLELRNKLGSTSHADDATFLTDRVRTESVKVLPGFVVLTRENLLAFLEPSGKRVEECEGECEVETGRRVGAELVVSGEVLKFGTQLKINLKVHETRGGALLNGEQVSGKDLDALDRNLRAKVASLLAPVAGAAPRGAGPDGAAAAAPGPGAGAAGAVQDAAAGAAPGGGPARPGVDPAKLAVLEFDVAEGLRHKVDRVYFSDRVRGAFGERGQELFVMTRESVDALLAAVGKSPEDCQGECEVETGRRMGADYVVSGRITGVGTQVALTMRLHSTRDGRLLRTAEATADDVDGLLRSCDPAIRRLASTSLDGSKATLSVETGRPGLALEIDGEKVGPSPLADRELAPGAHEVRIVDPCWTSAVEKVVLKKGEERKLRLAGEPLLTELAITLEDESEEQPAARARLDGKLLGKVPGTFRVPLCSKKLVVESFGIKVVPELVLQGGRLAPVHIRLGRDAEGSPAAPGAAAAEAAPEWTGTRLADPPRRSRHVISWLGLGSGAASLAAGVYLAAQVSSARDELSRGGLTQSKATADLDTIKGSTPTIANALLITGAALVVVAAVAWFAGAP